MESDSEDETLKTYATLENVNTEPATNYQLQFEQFVVAEKSDDESGGDDEEEEVPSDQEEEDQHYREDEIPVFEEFFDLMGISSQAEGCILKSEDVAVIESCDHKELKHLLFLNRSKNFMLMQLFKKVKDQLLDCRNDIESVIKLSQNEQGDPQFMFLTHLAAPYFKTKKDMFSPCHNEDTLARRRNGELSIYTNAITPKWSRTECDSLITAVKLTYNHNKQKAIIRKITPLRIKLGSEEGDSALQYVEEIDRLEEELRDLKEIGSNDVPPLGQDDYIDWDHISVQYLAEKHNAQECRAFWHIYLHPDINKSNWNAEENTKIKELVKKYNEQNWDQIALELGTKRSGFSVCLHYVSVLCEQFTRVRFTKEEDNLIMEHVERLRIGSYIPWNIIESFIPNRSRNQLVHRYKYFLNTTNHGSGPFSEVEDILILILVDRFGRNYSKFAHYVPHRSYMQIKNRYDIHLQMCSAMGGFTLEEDQTLMTYMASNKFRNLGSLSHLMNRTRGQLRQRFKTLKTFLEKNPTLTLANAPRRVTCAKETNRRLEFLKYIAEQFKGYTDVPTMEEIEEKLGMNSSKNSSKYFKSQSATNVDSLLINFFSNSYKLKQKPIETTTHKIKEAAEAVFDVLNKWKVQLEIPEEVKKTNYLDVIDIEILNTLREKYKQTNIDITAAVDDLIPPNLNSIVAMRGVLLRNKLCKRTKNNMIVTLKDELPLIRNRVDDQLASELIEMLKGIDPNQINQIENERCLFLERFISLFMWPAIFSLEPPSETLLDAELGIQKTPVPSTSKSQKDNRKKKISTLKPRTDANGEPLTKKIKLIPKENKNDTNKQPTRVSLRQKMISTRLKDSTGEIFENKNDSDPLLLDEREFPPYEVKPQLFDSKNVSQDSLFQTEVTSHTMHEFDDVTNSPLSENGISHTFEENHQIELESRMKIPLSDNATINTENNSLVSENRMEIAANVEKTQDNAKNRRIIKVIKNRADGTNKPTNRENRDDSNSQNELKPRKIIKIVKLNNVSKNTALGQEKKLNNTRETNGLPPNLIRVDKSVVENGFKNKKPIKLFVIQKLKMKDGTIKTITKPYLGDKLPDSLNTQENIENKSSKVPIACTEKVVTQKKVNTSDKSSRITLKPPVGKTNVNSKKPVLHKKLLGDSFDILDVISIADSVKKETNVERSDVIEEAPERSNKADSGKLDVVLKDNVKQFSKRLITKLSTSTQALFLTSSNSSNECRSLGNSSIRDKEDVCKLDEFLKTFQSDHDSLTQGVVDLTEEEVTKKEIQLLDRLIKSETL